jgi:FKBP-type peptidyl-prolyl cis-trans isomerase FklB
MNKCVFSLLFMILIQQVTVAAGGSDAKAEGQRFLEENSKKEGVVTLESGLQYKIITEGNGLRPGVEDNVEVFYHGYLLNGREFDGTDIIRPPAVLKVNQLIKGWTEALQLMPVGSIWEIYVPSDLAYGEKGSGSVIPPHSTLIFELELVSIL